MKNIIKLLPILSAPVAFAGSVNITLTPSFETLIETGLSSDANFTQSSAYLGTEEQQNYIIVEGLQEMAYNSTSYLQSDTTVINTNKEAVEFGSIQIDMPLPQIDENSSTSPIIGIIPRTGSFNNYQPVFNEDDLNADSTGSLHLRSDGTGDIRSLIHDVFFAGTLTWELNDYDELTLSSFSMTDGNQTYDFFESTLYLLNGSYSGTLNRSDAGANFSNFATAIRVNAYDSDGDGEADIIDQDTEYWYGPNFYPYSKSSNPEDIKSVNWIWSEWFGYFCIYNDGVQWIYHELHGFLFPIIANGEYEYDVWAYDIGFNGWLYLDKDNYGQDLIYDYSAKEYRSFQGIDVDTGHRIFSDKKNGSILVPLSM